MTMHYEISLDLLDTSTVCDDNAINPLEILINRELEALAMRYGYDSIEEFLIDNLDVTIN